MAPSGTETGPMRTMRRTGSLGRPRSAFRAPRSALHEVLYCGYRYDSETALYHVRRRPYHPTLGRWLSRDPIGYESDIALYAYALSSPMLYVDWNGDEPTPATRNSKPAPEPTLPAYKSVFKPSDESEKYWYAPVTFDEMLLGKATECAPSITLPVNLEVALAESVTGTRNTGEEYGGEVVVNGDGTYTIWGSVQGSVNRRGGKSVDTRSALDPRVLADIVINKTRRFHGRYHTHPAKSTNFSTGDIEGFLDPEDAYSFNVMANCDGSVVRAVVSLQADASDTAEPRSATTRNAQRLSYSPATLAPDQKTGGLFTEEVKRKYGRALEAYGDALLAREAQKLRFCFYKREGRRGPLTRIAHDDTVVLKQPLPSDFLAP